MSIPDREAQLKAQTKVTGIDFISVEKTLQKTLDVHFYVPPSKLTPDRLSIALPDGDNADILKKIRIYSPFGSAPDVPVKAIAWFGEVLKITTEKTGDFTLYKLKIDSEQIDPYYNDITFSFKANCPSDLDCATPEEDCPSEEPVDVSVNYLARDFWSFRRSLLEFASLRYPDWPDRLEADAGVMLVEVMSALGDEMAYYQDRVGREAYLETATQRRSLRRHGRVVDYQLHDGLGANVWLDVSVNVDMGSISAGTDVWAANDNGSKVEFEVGRGLRTALKHAQYPVSNKRNTLAPHIWDEEQLCLQVGSTTVYVEGNIEDDDDFLFNDQIEGLPGQIPGRWFLLKTNPKNPAQAARAHMVRVTAMMKMTDPVLNKTITRLSWEQEQALPFELDLTIMEVRGNLIPATTGRTFTRYFILGADFNDFNAFTLAEQQALHLANDYREIPRAVERSGPDGAVTYLFSLPDSEQTPLVWLGPATEWAAPEIVLEEITFDGAKWNSVGKWEWKRSLIGINSSQAEDPHFTLDDGIWKPVVTYQRSGETFIHWDYAGDKGSTIRFGDGEFGRIPVAKTVFKVSYRLGEKRRSNVSANTIKYMKEQPAFVDSITNPMPAFGGTDEETADELRQLAPEAFRSITYRAVRPEDYAEAAERLPWVQRAGATFRWTGSWLTAFVSPDPRGMAILKDELRLDLLRQMDRFRQVGRDVNVMAPSYADMDIEIEICITPEAYAGQVREKVLDRLTGKKGAVTKPGYFSADNFTFGTALNRSALEAVVQAEEGVLAVKNITYRRRGWFGWRTLELAPYYPGDQTIIRIENDPLHPERGVVRLKL